ncbi:MAG: hypothetical protein ACI9BH_001751 [Paracoccaceae bacterium]|jgi:hypothetical protein
MFGVVLWSDAQENKAVIWCEDHGDLAFYRQPENADNVALDAGDWVQFNMTADRHLRFAHNPKLVFEGAYPDLADALTSAASSNDTLDPPTHSRVSAEIIPFARPHTPHVAEPAPLPTANHAY